MFYKAEVLLFKLMTANSLEHSHGGSGIPVACKYLVPKLILIKIFYICLELIRDLPVHG